jgi:hypothetical protein
MRIRVKDIIVEGNKRTWGASRKLDRTISRRLKEIERRT